MFDRPLVNVNYASDVVVIPVLRPWTVEDIVHVQPGAHALPPWTDLSLKDAYVWYSRTGKTTEYMSPWQYLGYKVGTYAYKRWWFGVTGAYMSYHKWLDRFPAPIANWIDKNRKRARTVYESGRQIKVRLF